MIWIWTSVYRCERFRRLFIYLINSFTQKTQRILANPSLFLTFSVCISYSLISRKRELTCKNLGAVKFSSELKHEFFLQGNVDGELSPKMSPKLPRS